MTTMKRLGVYSRLITAFHPTVESMERVSEAALIQSPYVVIDEGQEVLIHAMHYKAPGRERSIEFYCLARGNDDTSSYRPKEIRSDQLFRVGGGSVS